MRTVFLLASILLVGFSCTKFGKNVTVKGRVLNPVTGEGIPGIPVRLFKAKLTSLPADYKVVKESTSGADGSFELNKLGLASYSAKCDVPGDYYSLGWTKNGGQTFIDNFDLDVKKGKTMRADYYAVPYAYLQLDIHNSNCQGSTDQFKLYAEGTQVDMSKYGLMLDEMGCYQYTASGHSKLPMGKRYYRWEVTRNGITTVFYDTIYLAEGEYKTYTINY